MIAVLGASRPELGLLLHIGGAAVFFGAVTVAAVTQLTATKVAEPDRLRASLRRLWRRRALWL